MCVRVCVRGTYQLTHFCVRRFDVCQGDVSADTFCVS